MKIRSILCVISGLILISGISAIAAVKNGVLQVTKESTVYACVCDETCGCGTIGTVKGKCQCGHDLAKVTISKVENGVAEFKHEGATHRIPLNGKYACACESGNSCCDIISQKPVQCGCGKEMKSLK
jgi:hypothetical protein